MQNEDDLQLSYDMLPQSRQFKQDNSQPNLMLQPITTQQRFNQNPQKSSQITSFKQPLPFSQQSPKLTQQSLNQQARKFRSYLNQKVQQLKKSKEIASKHEQKSKTTNLRKIISNEQAKKSEQTKKNQAENHANINRQNKGSVNKTIQPSVTSMSTHKMESVKKEQHQKRFSNSHSNLIKNAQRNSDKKQPSVAKNAITQIKKSLNLQSAIPKSSKLPNIPNHTKTSLNSQHPKSSEPTKKSINNPSQKQLPKPRQTPQSKNSFRIKRTSNVSTSVPAVVEQQPAKRPPPINTQKSITIQKPKLQEKQSPLHQGKNKKIREQFMRLNEEERKLQEQILRNHPQTKRALDMVMKKYELSTQAWNKYQIRKDIPLDQPNKQSQAGKSPQKHQKQSRISKLQPKVQQEQKRTQSPLRKQKLVNSFLDQQLTKINNLLKSKQRDIKKYESKVQKNPYIQFLKQMPEDILQEPQQQQQPQPIVPPSQNIQTGNNFASTYSTVMNEMKNKKWGLKQRITFQTHRDSPEKDNKRFTKISANNPFQSNKKAFNSEGEHQIQKTEQSNDPYSKIQVNSRLKNLLLD